MEEKDGRRIPDRVTAGRTLDEREPVVVPRSQVTVKTAFTVSMVLLGVGAFAWLVVHSKIAILLTIVSALLAMALNRAVDVLSARGMRRGLAVGLVMVGFILVIAGLVGIVAPMAASQLREVVDRGPELWERVQASKPYTWANDTFDLDRRLRELAGEEGWVERSATPALKAVGGVFAGLGAIITILFLTLFMLLYGGRLVRGALAEALPAHRERYERVAGKIYRSIGGYLGGLNVIALLNATAMSVFLAILGVPFWLPLGILSGLGSFLPLIGVTISGVLIVGIAALTDGLVAAVIALVYITLYQQFENHVVVPLVYKRTVAVNPLLTLLGILFLAELLGVVGAFLAVPIIACLQIMLRELFLLRRERLGLPLEGEVAAPFRRRRALWRRTREA